MIKNYFKVAIRNIIKHKGFSVIIIVALTVGIACSILILLFVTHELSYDKFHEKADNIYRIAVRASIGDTPIRQTYSSSETFRKLILDFPEIVAEALIGIDQSQAAVLDCQVTRHGVEITVIRAFHHETRAWVA